MQSYIVPKAVLDMLVEIAKSAPIPYAQTQAMWKQIEELQPTPPPELRGDEV